MSTIALVTGANQGLGLALVEGLARRLGPGDVVYLTGRDRARVDRAAATIGDARAEVRPRRLDVTDGPAVAALAAELRDTHGGVDVVLSNHYRRVLPADDPATVIDAYVEANNLGTTRVLRAFSPLLRDGARLLVVASSLGTLDHLPAHLRPRFDGAAMTLDGVDDAVRAWRDAVRERRDGAEGWPSFVNVPSKVAHVAAVRALARERRADDLARGILVAAVCPGMIDTGASRPWFDMTGAQTPEQAAVAVLDLALSRGPDPARHGRLVRFGKVLPWLSERRAGATAGSA